MTRASGFPAPFQLGPWLVQADLNRITGPGGAHQIEPRVMRVLLVLVEHAGDVVTRQDLLDEVWTDTIVGEEILTRAVSELRRVFGDDSRQPIYIETIRQHGYRLIMAVTRIVQEAPFTETPFTPGVVPTMVAPAAAPEPAPAPAPAPEDVPASVAVPAPAPAAPETRRLARTMVARAAPLVAVVLVAALAVTAARCWRGGDPASPPPVAAVPLTSYPGRELHPALSADGMRVAFAWSGPDGRSPGIYVKQRNSETALRLTAEAGWAAWPAWLPDGQSVAFVQSGDTVSAICLVPSLGGPVRRLREVASLVEGLTISTDGRRVAWAAREAAGGPFRLHGLDLAEPEAPWLPAPSAGEAGDVQPRLSPDGRWLAWVALGAGGDGDIVCAPLDGGQSRVVVHARGPVGGLAWSPDSRYLVYAAAPAGAYGLWQAPREGGRATPVPVGADFAWNPTIASATGDLAFEHVLMDQDLWRLRAVGREPWRFETTPLVVSTRWEAEPDLNPVDGRVAFVSSRSGSPQVWVAGADGGGPERLTDLAATAISHPRWSPDGLRLAFRAVTGGGAAVMIVPAAGGRPRAAPLEADDVLLADWTRDGRALLVAADLGDGWQIHRLDPVDGGRQTLTRGGGLTAAESPDGTRLYHTRPGLPGLWKQDLRGGGEPVLEVPGLPAGDRGVWRLAGAAICWVMRVGGGAVLMTHDPVSGRSRPLAELPGFAAGGLAVSPAGDLILYARSGEVAGDLMLVPRYAAVDK